MSTVASMTGYSHWLACYVPVIMNTVAGCYSVTAAFASSFKHTHGFTGVNGIRTLVNKQVISLEFTLHLSQDAGRLLVKCRVVTPFDPTLL